MKKITFLLLLLSSFAYSQEKIKAYIQKTETISFDQYDFLKKVNGFCPDILVTRQVRNNVVSDLKDQRILNTELVYEVPSDCKYYYVTINPELYRLEYSYLMLDNTLCYGDVSHFNGDIVRTHFKSKGDTRLIQFFINGKLTSEKKN